MGLRAANRRTLHVYHTPVQAIVAEIVDRFVNSEAESQVFSLLITVGSPKLACQSDFADDTDPGPIAGREARPLAKENAALLLAGLQTRLPGTWFAQMAVNNGQSIKVTSSLPRTYVRGVVAAMRHGRLQPGHRPTR